MDTAMPVDSECWTTFREHGCSFSRVHPQLTRPGSLAGGSHPGNQAGVIDLGLAHVTDYEEPLAYQSRVGSALQYAVSDRIHDEWDLHLLQEEAADNYAPR